MYSADILRMMFKSLSSHSLSSQFCLCGARHQCNWHDKAASRSRALVVGSWLEFTSHLQSARTMATRFVWGS